MFFYCQSLQKTIFYFSLRYPDCTASTILSKRIRRSLCIFSSFFVSRDVRAARMLVRRELTFFEVLNIIPFTILFHLGFFYESKFPYRVSGHGARDDGVSVSGLWVWHSGAAKRAEPLVGHGHDGVGQHPAQVGNHRGRFPVLADKRPCCTNAP